MEIIDTEKSRGLFDEDVSQVLAFLEAKGVKSESYRRFLSQTHGGYALDNSLRIGGDVYIVEMFFGKSDDFVRDLVKCNALLEMDNSRFVAIGTFLGDDIFGIIPKDEGIYFCALDDTRLENLIKIADTFEQFLYIIMQKEEDGR